MRSSAVDPFDDVNLDDPYPMHEELREAGPVVHLERYDVYAVARHAEGGAVLRDHEAFGSARGVGLSDFAREKPWRPPSLLLEADPPEHTTARAAVTSVLKRQAVIELREGFLHRAREIVDELVERRDVDGVTDLAHEFPLTVFPAAMGIQASGREYLLPYGAMVFNGFGPPNAHFDKAMAAGAAVRDTIMSMTRPENLDPNGLAHKIHVTAGEAGYTDDERGLIVRSVLSAGVDTTVHAIGNALLCFSEAPDQWDILHADPDLADGAFDECVRLEAPVQTFFRTTCRDIELGDVPIPEGAKVLVFMAAGNRDPRKWDDPDRLDIRRKTAGHLGFGNGIHACVGRVLARIEGECVLRALAERVARIERTGEPVRQLSNTLRGLDSLPLRLHPA